MVTRKINDDITLAYLLNKTLERAYPVGSIYMSMNPTDPGKLFGGKWERIQNTFLLAAGSSYPAGSTGGEATHTLSENEMPNHKHPGATYAAGWNGWPYGTYPFEQTGYIFKWPDVFVNSGAGDYSGYVGGTDLPGTQTTGGGAPHNNMPPYLTVYMWQRVA